MAWTVPATAVAGSALTAAMWNATIRDNLNETEAALASAAAQVFVATGANSIVERQVSGATVTATETTASTTFTNLATVGPTVTVDTGTSALVIASSTLSGNTAGQFIDASYAVSGATTIAAGFAILDYRVAFLGGASDQIRMSGMAFETGLTPGTNTFQLKYKSSAGTATFLYRNLFVWPF